jgi:hypothetical protein
VAYAFFDTPAIHGIPGIKERAQAGLWRAMPGAVDAPGGKVLGSVINEYHRAA